MSPAVPAVVYEDVTIQARRQPGNNVISMERLSLRFAITSRNGHSACLAHSSLRFLSLLYNILPE